MIQVEMMVLGVFKPLNQNLSRVDDAKGSGKGSIFSDLCEPYKALEVVCERLCV